MTVPALEQIQVYEWGKWEVDLGRRELRANGVQVPIGGRAFAIMEVLLQADGNLVSNKELVERVWSGAMVEDNTIQVHISAVRKALGPDRGILKTVSGRGYRLLENWTPRNRVVPRPVVAPKRLPASPMRTNLPLPGSDLIGRTVAVQRLQDLLSAYRVVTLTGPGGIGKTRLGLEAARSLFSELQADVWVVELASLSDPSLLPSTIAKALGLELATNEVSADTLARAIADLRLLLMLDNCEHIVSAVAELTETIVRISPNVTVLATSRELLRIDGEFVYRVPPLDVPSGSVTGVGSPLQHSAVQLFVARTQALQSGFAPNREDLVAIGSICRRLDGIPLAIEFAAARAATLGLQPVLSRLDERFSLLTVGRRTALPRHRTLRATLDWSYDLLSTAEQRLLHFLAVFPGGFTLEAAIAVMRESGIQGSSVTEDISNLVAKSLVSVDTFGATARWRLLETTREYALEKLAQSGEAEQAARQHAMYFRDLVAAASAPQLTTETMTRYAREIDNVRAALDWAYSSAVDPAIGVVLTAAYVPVWFYLLQMVECSERVEQALVSLDPASSLDPRLRAQLHTTLGFAMLNTAGLAQKTGAILARGLELAEDLGDEDLQMRAMWAMWSLYFNSGKYPAARAAAERLLEVAERTGHPDNVLVGHRLLGSALHFLGRQPEAEHYLRLVLERQMTQADQSNPMWFLVDQRIVARAMLARVLMIRGLIDQARNHADLSLREALAADDKLSVCYALRNAVCPIALATGDLDVAKSSVARLTDLVTRQGMTFWMSWGQCLEGQLLVYQGDFDKGVPLLQTGLNARAQAGWLMRNPEFRGVLAEGQAGGGRLTDAISSIEAAISEAHEGGQLWCVAELYRIKGELLLLSAKRHSASEAEEAFFTALELARQQGALFWELRASLCLARLRIKQHGPADARRLLEPVFDRMTEGLRTADFEAAKILLQDLPPD